MSIYTERYNVGWSMQDKGEETVVYAVPKYREREREM